MAGIVLAQQPRRLGEEGARASAAAPKGAAPAAKDASAPAARRAPGSSCARRRPPSAKDKDGKEEKKDLNICLTHHERLDGNTGMVLVSAAVRQVEGQDKQHFMVMVPLGMMLQPGMRATVYPKDLGTRCRRTRRSTRAKLKGIKLAYTLCHPAGCTAEMEATPELLADLKTGGGMVVFAINAGGAPSVSRCRSAASSSPTPAPRSTTSSTARRARR